MPLADKVEPNQKVGRVDSVTLIAVATGNPDGICEERIRPAHINMVPAPNNMAIAAPM